MQRQWTPEEEEFLKRNIGLLCHKQMARRLRRTRLSVKRKLHRLGLVVPLTPTAKWQADLRRYRQAGYNDREIARIMGCATITVWRRRRYMGGKMVKPFPRNHRWKERLLQLHKQGLSDGQIAYIFDINVRTAAYRRRSLGLPANERVLLLPTVTAGGRIRRFMETSHEHERRYQATAP